MNNKVNVSIVFIGHVDAGKSTLSGNIMLLSGSIDKRTIDKNLLVQATHRLNSFFSNDSLLFSKFRNFGLKVFNKSLFLKKQSMLFAMGLKDFKF